MQSRSGLLRTPPGRKTASGQAMDKASIGRGRGRRYEVAGFEPTSQDSYTVRDLAAVRHLRLIEHIADLGNATVEALAELMDVMPQAIRGDLRLLDERGLLSRVRGGAMAGPLAIDFLGAFKVDRA